jgi:hypothetical protein
MSNIDRAPHPIHSRKLPSFNRAVTGSDGITGLNRTEKGPPRKLRPTRITLRRSAWIADTPREVRNQTVSDAENRPDFRACYGPGIYSWNGDLRAIEEAEG